MDRQAWTLRGFNRKRARFGEDTCELITQDLVDDGANGKTLGTTTVATGIVCYVEQLGSSSQQVVGGMTYNRSHRITMESTDATRDITPDYQIKVIARENNEQRIFEQPVIEKGSYNPLTKVLCTLTEGHRQPGQI